MEARTIRTGQSSKDDGQSGSPERERERERLDAAAVTAGKCGSNERTAAGEEGNDFPADLFV
jgi:hypothetical protein